MSAQQIKKPVNKPQAAKKEQKPPVYSSVKKAPQTLFSWFDNWFEKNSTFLLYFILGIGLLFSILQFQARMDIGGDDSGYLTRASDFVHKGIFPSYQGPLYPMVLSLFISFMGIKIVFLKSLSVIFNFVALLFLYKAFKNRIPNFILYWVMLLTAINSYLLHYASLTYNESFYTALQYIFFFVFFKFLDYLKANPDATLKETWKKWLLVGLLIFLMAFTRNIGIMCFGGVVLYFLIRKQFKYALYTFGAFLAFEVPINLIEKLFWHSDSQWSSQGNRLLLKNFYNPAEGNETFNGFIMRFFQNSNLYISKRFFQIIGFRAEDAIEVYSGLTICFVLLLLFALYRIIKSKNNYLLVSLFYVVSMAGATFIVLQTNWDQPRMIMIYVPLFFMFFFYALYDTFKNSWGIQFLTLFLIIGVFISEFGNTIKATQNNLPILSKNFKGDIYAGFTPDWVNYLKLSAWCVNLPKDSIVACRKGPMSSVYADGRDFFNVSTIDEKVTNADTVIAMFKKQKIRYILLAKLRMNPNVATGQYINTMERFIAPVARTYPKMLKFIKQEGTTEEAQVWEVNY